MFGPVGKALDDRDELIRSQLAAVGDNSAEVENLIVRYFLRVLIRRWRLARDRSSMPSSSGLFGVCLSIGCGCRDAKIELTD